MKVMVTGAGGMLGQALVRELQAGSEKVVGFTRAELDVTKRYQVEKAIQSHCPDAVVQCAAYTAVDSAESDSENAFLLNATAAGYVAEACQRIGCLFVYPSTDYVFGGISAVPFRPDDPVAPQNVYGQSKAAGEEQARHAAESLIVRTSWLYGRGGKNFVQTIVDLSADRSTLKIVDDQVGLPTWTGSLAATIARLLKVRAVGTFHAADSGEGVSWYGFATEILARIGARTQLVPISSEEFGAQAPRPAYSVLDCSDTEELLGVSMLARENSLAEYLRFLKAT